MGLNNSINRHPSGRASLSQQGSVLTIITRIRRWDIWYSTPTRLRSRTNDSKQQQYTRPDETQKEEIRWTTSRQVIRLLVVAFFSLYLRFYTYSQNNASLRLAVLCLHIITTILIITLLTAKNIPHYFKDICPLIKRVGRVISFFLRAADEGPRARCIMYTALYQV